MNDQDGRRWLLSQPLLNCAGGRTCGAALVLSKEEKMCDRVDRFFHILSIKDAYENYISRKKITCSKCMIRMTDEGVANYD